MSKSSEKWICGKYLVAEEPSSSPSCPACNSDETVVFIGADNHDFWISCGDCSTTERYSE